MTSLVERPPHDGTAPLPSALTVPEWAMLSCVASSFMRLSNAVAVVLVTLSATKKVQCGVLLNPTDQRCYRMLVLRLYESVEEVPFNQMHTAETAIAVQLASVCVAEKLREATVLFVQSCHLGNNSLRITTALRPEHSVIEFGRPNEPYFYHVHLICRGNPKAAYLSEFGSDAILGGPEAEAHFVCLELATDKKVLLPDEQHQIATALGECLTTTEESVFQDSLGAQIILLLKR